MAEIILICENVDLPSTISQLAIPPDAVMFLERIPSRWLNRAEVADGIRLTAFDPGTDWEQWERGRVFCSQWELRWEEHGAVYTGVTVALPNFTAGPSLAQCKRKDAGYYLWGQRDGDRFIELQVARVLTYPVTAGTRVKLRVAEWFDVAGELVASRLIGLEGGS